MTSDDPRRFRIGSRLAHAGWPGPLCKAQGLQLTSRQPMYFFAKSRWRSHQWLDFTMTTAPLDQSM